uniref:SAP domain-containing protein n=1 Tax=Gadus morhua TaxID=8049 RepID=A0A8C5CZ44_GADMO
MLTPLPPPALAPLAVNHGKFPKQEDSYAFEEDSSSDGLSPEQHHADESPGSAGPSSLEPVGSTPSSSSSPSLTSPRQGGVTRDSSDPGQEEGLSDANRSQPSMPLSVPAIVKSKTSDKNRHKKPKDVKPKVKKLKYHQYIPPDQKAEKSPPPMDSAYARLLQQQQLFLQLQILSQQKHAQSQAHNGHAQHAVHAHQNQAQIPQRQPTFSYQPMATSAPNHKGDHLTPCSSSGPPSAANSTSSSPVKTSYPNQSSLSPVKPGPLPANLDDLKVSELRQQLRVRGMPVSGTKTALIERLRPYRDQGVCDPHLHQHHHHHHLHPASAAMTFPVTPAGSLSQSSYQSPSSSSGAPSQGGYFPYPSTSSTPPISPASSSSELSLSGSLPDSFSDVPMCSPGQRFALLGASPGRAPGVEEGAGGGARGGGGGGEGEGTVEAEKDKMLVEKQKVIEELTWKLHQEQRQVEELKLQLHQRKRCYGSTQDNAPSPTAPHPLSMHHPHQHHQHHPPALGGQQFFGVTIKQEPMSMSSSCPLSSHKPLEELSHCGASHPNAMPVPAGPRCTDPGSAPATGSPQAPMSAFPSPQRSPQSPPSGRAPGSPRSCSPNQPYLLSPPPHLRDGCGLPLPQGRGRHAQMQQKSGGQPLSSPYPSDQRGPHGAFSPGGGGDCGHAHRGHAKAPPLSNPPKMSVLPSPRQVSQTTAFSSSESAVCDLRHPPCYEDAVKQQLSRSQQMDELLDVLIASGGKNIPYLAPYFGSSRCECKDALVSPPPVCHSPLAFSFSSRAAR